MKESLQRLCERFITNRDLIRKVLKTESAYIYPVCANIFCSGGRDANEEQLLACKQVLKEKTGPFSNFRGNLRAPVVSMLAAGGSPEARMDRALANYDMLKNEFTASQYLALAAFLLTDLGNAGSSPDIARRGKDLYRRMKREHPFLTASEDSVFAVFMAFSEKSDDELIQDMESCYGLLRRLFPASNCLQSVSHVLCLGPGSPEMKVSRLSELYGAIRAAGGKYGKYYELSTLAALSLLEEEIPAMAADVMEADAYLAEQKGYGAFGLDRKARLMHAAMLVSDDILCRRQMSPVANPSVEAQAAASAAAGVPLAGTLALVVAQQAAMCAVMASTAATAASTAR